MLKRKSAESHIDDSFTSTKRVKLDGLSVSSPTLRDSSPQSPPEPSEPHQACTSPPQNSPPMSSRKRAADDSLDAQSKRQKIDDDPSDSRSRSLSPWPSVGYDSPDEDDIRDTELTEKFRIAHEAEEKRLEDIRQKYINFRKARLPSPVGSESDLDSDLDEHGCHPCFLGLEWDDSRIEEVMGAAYASRMRTRRRNYRRSHNGEEGYPGLKPKSPSPPRRSPRHTTNNDDTISTRVIKTGGVSKRQKKGTKLNTRRSASRANIQQSLPREPQPSQQQPGVCLNQTRNRKRKQPSGDSEARYTRRSTRRNGGCDLWELDSRGTARLVG